MSEENKVVEVLQSSIDTFNLKNNRYDNAYEKQGAIISILAENIKLETESDYTRFNLLNAIVVKLLRYSANFNNPHHDDLNDLITYAAMLSSLDE